MTESEKIKYKELMARRKTLLRQYKTLEKREKKNNCTEKKVAKMKEGPKKEELDSQRLNELASIASEYDTIAKEMDKLAKDMQAFKEALGD